MPMVTVASKLPFPLVLRTFDMVDQTEPVMGGGVRTVSVARQREKTVTIKGYGTPFGKAPEAAIVGGYALTPNVDADFFNEWMKQNARHEAVINKLIFANEKQETVEKMAKERVAIRNGLEAVDPSNLPKGIQKADVK